VRVLLRGRPALSRSRTVTVVRSRFASCTSRSLAGERRILILFVRLLRIENLVEPSFTISLPADFAAVRGAVSSSLPVQRRAPAHLRGISATPLGATFTVPPLIRTKEALRFRRGELVLGGVLTFTETVVDPLRPAELVTLSLAE
jgi:hypothetical protein